MTFSSSSCDSFCYQSLHFYHGINIAGELDLLFVCSLLRMEMFPFEIIITGSHYFVVKLLTNVNLWYIANTFVDVCLATV